MNEWTGQKARALKISGFIVSKLRCTFGNEVRKPLTEISEGILEAGTFEFPSVKTKPQKSL